MHARGADLVCFPVADLRHSSNSSASQLGVLVTVSPAVDCSLNEASFVTQVWVQLCECPSYGIAFAFIMQAVAFVLILAYTGARVNTVGCLEVLAKLLNVY